MAVVITDRHGTGLDLTHELERRVRQVAAHAHPVFVANGWTYGFTNPRIPSENELVATLRSLTRSVLRNPGPGAGSSSGRFHVIMTESGAIKIGVEFDGSSW